MPKKVEMEEGYLSENLDYNYGFLKAKFNYDYNNKILYKLRKVIQWDNDKLQDFWLKHISYKFIKPRNRELLIDWLKSMFFNRSFAEAYVKSNRTRMTMRLSKFVKAKIIKIVIKSNELLGKNINETEIYSIREYKEKLKNMYLTFQEEKNKNDQN